MEISTRIHDQLLGAAVDMMQRDEKEIANLKRLLAWFVAQFRGESGAGENHWKQFAEYEEAAAIVDAMED